MLIINARNRKLDSKIFKNENKNFNIKLLINLINSKLYIWTKTSGIFECKTYASNKLFK